MVLHAHHGYVVELGFIADEGVDSAPDFVDQFVYFLRTGIVQGVYHTIGAEHDLEEKKTTSNPTFGYAMFGFLMGAGIAAFGWLLELIVGSGWTLRIFSGLGWGLGVGCSVIRAIVFVGLLLYGLYDDHRYR